MPYIIRPRSARSIAAAVCGSALLSCAVPAMASAACSTSPTTKAFAQWRDEASYTLVQGGNFASGPPGWELNKAVVTSGEASSTGDTHALAIPPSMNASAIRTMSSRSSVKPMSALATAPQRYQEAKFARVRDCPQALITRETLYDAASLPA